MTKRKDLMFLVYPFIKCYLSTKKKKKKKNKFAKEILQFLHFSKNEVFRHGFLH